MIVIGLIGAGILAGCSSTALTPQQRTKFEKVSLAGVETAADAYRKPDATRSPGMANKIPLVTGGGMIPALIGSAIDSAVTSSQQSKFEERNPTAVQDAELLLSTSPGQAVLAKLRGTLNDRSFFKDRLSDSADPRLTLTIAKFGLVRGYSKDDSNPTFTYSLTVEMSVTAKDGEKLLSTVVVGYPEAAETLGFWLTQDAKVEGRIAEAVDSVVKRLVDALDVRLSAAR